jgi:hypothetical protein
MVRFVFYYLVSSSQLLLYYATIPISNHDFRSRPERHRPRLIEIAPYPSGPSARRLCKTTRKAV